MMRACIYALILSVGIASPTLAQQQPTADQQALLDMQKRLNAAPNMSLQPVETLTCEQMLTELSNAGKHISGGLDPSYGAEARALHDESMGKAPPSGANNAETAANNRARMDKLGAQMANATQGLDMQRMMAVSNRFTAQKCPTPTGPPTHQ